MKIQSPLIAELLLIDMTVHVSSLLIKISAVKSISPITSSMRMVDLSLLPTHSISMLLNLKNIQLMSHKEEYP